MNITIEKILPEHNAELAIIIRNALTEFGANKPGTVFYDDSTDHLFELFSGGGGHYHVALLDGKVIGGAGIFPTEGLEQDTCELVKMYLSPVARGKGIGKMLMSQCLDTAADNGYQQVYIETMPELTAAIPLYEKFGFSYLKAPLGNSGHNGCSIWMLKDLNKGIPGKKKEEKK